MTEACDSCDCDCDRSDIDPPCGGKVNVVDEWYDEESGDSGWIHLCERHAAMADERLS